MKYTSEIITHLEPQQVFVFGSNEAGIHGAGAALQARKFGATLRQGFGPSGNTFAIPTKDWEIQTLSLHNIHFYVERFLAYANLQRKSVFLVTKIGCGLAGYKPAEIAPMFRVHSDNVILPKEFYLV